MATQKRVREILDEVYNHGYNQAVKDIFSETLCGKIASAIVLILLLTCVISIFIFKHPLTISGIWVLIIITSVVVAIIVSTHVNSHLEKHRVNVLVFDIENRINELVYELTTKKQLKDK